MSCVEQVGLLTGSVAATASAATTTTIAATTATAAAATTATAVGAATTAATAATAVGAATTAAASTAGATTTAAVATTAATTVAAAATTTAAATAAAAETTRTLFTWAGFVDDHSAAINRLAVHAIDGSLRFRVIAHLHKAEALGAAGLAVHHDLGRRDVAELRKSLEQRIVAHRISQITDVQFVSHGEPLNEPEKPCGAQPCVNHSDERCGCQTQTPNYGRRQVLPAKRAHVKCCFVAPVLTLDPCWVLPQTHGLANRS